MTSMGVCDDVVAVLDAEFVTRGEEEKDSAGTTGFCDTLQRILNTLYRVVGKLCLPVRQSFVFDLSRSEIADQ